MRDENSIIIGRNAVLEALRSETTVERLFILEGCKDGPISTILREAKKQSLPVDFLKKERLDEISYEKKHQGVVAYVAAYKYFEVEDMLSDAKSKGEDPFLFLLDGIEDPHNLGAMIRTANLCGAHGVIIKNRGAVGITATVVKASAGAVTHTKVAKVTNLNRTIDELKSRGIWIYAVTMGARDYETVDFRDGTALVIGAEGEGISRLTMEKCDMGVSLPLMGKLDSLNASVAAGVMMYRVLSCRRK